MNFAQRTEATNQAIEEAKTECAGLVEQCRQVAQNAKDQLEVKLAEFVRAAEKEHDRLDAELAGDMMRSLRVRAGLLGTFRRQESIAIASDWLAFSRRSVDELGVGPDWRLLGCAFASAAGVGAHTGNEEFFKFGAANPAGSAVLAAIKAIETKAPDAAIEEALRLIEVEIAKRAPAFEPDPGRFQALTSRAASPGIAKALEEHAKAVAAAEREARAAVETSPEEVERRRSWLERAKELADLGPTTGPGQYFGSKLAKYFR